MPHLSSSLGPSGEGLLAGSGRTGPALPMGSLGAYQQLLALPLSLPCLLSPLRQSRSCSVAAWKKLGKWMGLFLVTITHNFTADRSQGLILPCLCWIPGTHKWRKFLTLTFKKKKKANLQRQNGKAAAVGILDCPQKKMDKGYMRCAARKHPHQT